MFRAVLTILLALPMLMPQGVCLRKFDYVAGLLRTATATHVRTERTGEPHAKACGCGCQERSAQDAVDDTVSADDLGGRPAPCRDEPCCPAVCKAKLDKIVQAENPQPCGEVALVGFVLAPTADTCTPPSHRPRVTANAPPLYISFCTLLI